ncbi:MAG: endolytic transglycosylase MltG [Wenzhouxiangellaceae bacterium]
MRWLIGLLLVIMLMAAAVGAWGYREYQQFLQQPLTIAEEAPVISISPGSSYTAIVNQLRAAGMTDASWQWRLLGRLRQGTYQAGEYRLRSGQTPVQVLDQIAAGAVVHYYFTIIEGWTVAQLRQQLAELPKLTMIARDWSDERLADELGIEAHNADGNRLEGWFLPASYDYHLGHSDLDLLQRAHQAMTQALAQAWQQRQPELPLTSPYELLTLASIVEKETGVPDERSAIAGVFIRRLKQGMRLQTDPTIIYGLGAAFDGNLRRVHLRTDNPYNTYTRHGLPPSPIALPGSDALLAAGQPAAGEALFFVATGNGGHAFSATLAEHERNVDRYQRKR